LKKGRGEKIRWIKRTIMKKMEKRNLKRGKLENDRRRIWVKVKGTVSLGLIKLYAVKM
jgi:hypothetical protein